MLEITRDASRKPRGPTAAPLRVQLRTYKNDHGWVQSIAKCILPVSSTVLNMGLFARPTFSYFPGTDGGRCAGKDFF